MFRKIMNAEIGILKIMSVFFALTFLVINVSTSFADSFPAFPMAFYGEVTLNNENLKKGSRISVFSADKKVGEVILLEDGVYGYNDPTKIRLLVEEYSGEELVFKCFLDGDKKIEDKINYKGSFESGKTINKDLAFELEEEEGDEPEDSEPSRGGGGGGGFRLIDRDDKETSKEEDHKPKEEKTDEPEKKEEEEEVKNDLDEDEGEEREEDEPKEVKGYKHDQIEKILSEAEIVFNGDVNELALKNNTNRSLKLEQNIQKKYTRALIDGLDIEKENIFKITNFVGYGTPTTLRLGAGERAGVVSSYKNAFDRLPTSESDWGDVIKISNGRWPSDFSEEAESRANDLFKEVYLRDSDMNNSNDNAAITIIAYGLRPHNRNMESEMSSINIFNSIFNRFPSSTTDWDVIRSIAYSGATR